ncbi:MAG: CHRD domain-containing protein [Aliidongia sp.]
MKIQIRSGLSALTLAAIAAFALAPAAEAKVYQLHFEMTGKAETPPNTTTGKGHGSVTYDDQTNDMTWDITWSGLTGDATAAHFHGPAKKGEAAPPVVPIKDKPLASPLVGSTTITADQGKDLLAGKWYFNVHTEATPAASYAAR